MPKYLLGIDNGGTVAKAAVFGVDGREVAVAARKVSLVSPRPGHNELDAEQIWLAAAGSIKEAVAKAGIDARDIACVACTGFGNGLFLLDEKGRAVRNAIASSDGRARQYIEAWRRDGIDKKVRPLTMQSIWPAQPNALLNWMRDYEPHSLARARWVVSCKDYIRGRLTGEVYAEITDMSGTSLMNVGTMQYDDEVLRAFGIEEMRRLLPPVKRSADICGTVTAEAAALTGLAAGTPVAGGLFDIDACGLTTGMVDEGPLCMIIGTWGNNQYISKMPVVDEDVFMTSCYSIPGYYLMLEGSATSASNLEWFVTEFLQAERRQAEAQGRSVYDVCNDLVAGTRPEEAGIVFLPYLYGCSVSLDGKACFFGLEGWQKRGHLLRAIYEGVVFGHLWHVERLLKYRKQFESIRLTGGAARSEVWAQMFADALGAPVQVPDGSELGALGAAICAAVAAGCYSSYPEACAAMVRFSRTYRPDRAVGEVYRRKYERYKALLEALSGVWGRIRW